MCACVRMCVHAHRVADHLEAAIYYNVGIWGTAKGRLASPVGVRALWGYYLEDIGCVFFLLCSQRCFFVEDGRRCEERLAQGKMTERAPSETPEEERERERSPGFGRPGIVVSFQQVKLINRKV